MEDWVYRWDVFMNPYSCYETFTKQMYINLIKISWGGVTLHLTSMWTAPSCTFKVKIYPNSKVNMKAKYYLKSQKHETKWDILKPEWIYSDNTGTQKHQSPSFLFLSFLPLQSTAGSTGVYSACGLTFHISKHNAQTNTSVLTFTYIKKIAEALFWHTWLVIVSSLTAHSM